MCNGRSHMRPELLRVRCRRTCLQKACMAQAMHEARTTMPKHNIYMHGCHHVVEIFCILCSLLS